MTKHLSKLFIAVVAVSLVFLLPDVLTVSAQSTLNGSSGSTLGDSQGSTLGNSQGSTLGGCNTFVNGQFKLCDPLGVRNFCDLVKRLLDIVLAIGIPVAVFFLVWAGFKFIIARGSEEGLRVAKKNFQYVIIGIAVFLGAWTFATILSETIKTLDNSGKIQFCTR